MSSSDNRRIRVFVSSTFRDMVEERDELMSDGWPAVCCFCHDRHVELLEADLRWDIPEEQSTLKETRDSSRRWAELLSRRSSS